jgi:hypothetical protein
VKDSRGESSIYALCGPSDLHTYVPALSLEQFWTIKLIARTFHLVRTDSLVPSPNSWAASRLWRSWTCRAITLTVPNNLEFINLYESGLTEKFLKAFAKIKYGATSRYTASRSSYAAAVLIADCSVREAVEVICADQLHTWGDPLPLSHSIFPTETIPVHF